MVAGGQMVQGGAWSVLPKTHSRGGEKVLDRVGNLVDSSVPAGDVSGGRGKGCRERERGKRKFRVSLSFGHSATAPAASLKPTHSHS